MGQCYVFDVMLIRKAFKYRLQPKPEQLGFERLIDRRPARVVDTPLGRELLVRAPSGSCGKTPGELTGTWSGGGKSHPACPWARCGALSGG